MLETKHLPKHFSLLEKNLVRSNMPFLGGNEPNAADVAFFAVYNLYDRAGVNVNAAMVDCPKLKDALEGTLKLGNLKNFPKRGLYFTSDPEHDAF
jgi:glutathione S-transferase